MEQQVPLKKRKMQAIETKGRIFEATMSLIEEHGIENVQIEDISRKANVSMGLFYKYFANKADVITEALSQQANQYYENAKQSCLQGLSGEEKALEFTHYVADYNCNHLRKIDLKHNYATILTYTHRGEFIRNESRPIYAILLECVEEMKLAKMLPQDQSSDQIAKHIALIIRGVIVEYLLSNEPLDAVETAAKLVATYLKGLRVN